MGRSSPDRSGPEVAPRRFRKKPVAIDAMRLTADNAKAVCDWIHGATSGKAAVGYDDSGAVAIGTLEGTMTASVGDYIIQGISGEFYPCKPEIFEQTYEPCEDE